MMVRRPDWIFDGSEIEDPFGHGERAVQFIKALKHPKSTAPDKAFQLPMFWERIIRRVYGPRDDKGNRVVKNVFCLLPRGARKTTIGAALALLHTFGYEKVTGGQALVGASAEDQAAIAFDEALSIVQATPWLQKAAKEKASTYELEHPKSGSEFRAISSDGGAQLGKTPNFVLADELIAWKKRDLWKALRTGLVKVPNTLLFTITQAGRGQENLAFDLLSYARKVANGDAIDPGFLPVLFEMDAKADWEDEKLWHLVNPGLAEGFPDIDGLRQLAREAKEQPAERDNFRQFNLNVWLDHSASPFVDMSVYDEGNLPVDLDFLKEAPCWLALDLSATTDLTVVVACWGSPDDGFQVWPWYFCPGDSLQSRADRDGVPYPQWADDDFIIPTHGNVIDYRAVEAHIRHLCDRFNVQDIAFDPYMAQQVIGPLQEDGFTTTAMRQGTITMGPAIQALEIAVIGRKLRHGGHPILRWNFDNVAVKSCETDLKSFHKGKSKDRIDGAVATAMAVARCAADDTPKSFYASDQWSDDMAFV